MVVQPLYRMITKLKLASKAQGGGNTPFFFFGANMKYKPSVEVWEATFDQSPIGVCFVSIEGRFLKVNKALCKFLDYNEDELLDMTFQEITHSKDAGHDIAMLNRVENGELDGYTMTKRYLTKLDKTVWARLTVVAIRDNDNNLIHYLAHVQPLMNGEKLKMEQVSDKKIEVRPTIKMGEFVADNWKWFLSICFGCVVIFTGLGIRFWAIEQKANTAAERAQTYEKLLEEILKDK
jgi:PAS domain S-box-containing protein